mmetsp:Transcript_34874/g.78801  ORF Transcript_34874/g.78801 Transcript_34874/m.78801 type:complete len:509 (-) Transcript_34874:434-1960(-)
MEPAGGEEDVQVFGEEDGERIAAGDVPPGAQAERSPRAVPASEEDVADLMPTVAHVAGGGEQRSKLHLDEAALLQTHARVHLQPQRRGEPGQERREGERRAGEEPKRSDDLHPSATVLVEGSREEAWEGSRPQADRDAVGGAGDCRPGEEERKREVKADGHVGSHAPGHPHDQRALPFALAAARVPSSWIRRRVVSTVHEAAVELGGVAIAELSSGITGHFLAVHEKPQLHLPSCLARLRGKGQCQVQSVSLLEREAQRQLEGDHAGELRKGSTRSQELSFQRQDRARHLELRLDGNVVLLPISKEEAHADARRSCPDARRWISDLALRRQEDADRFVHLVLLAHQKRQLLLLLQPVCGLDLGHDRRHELLARGGTQGRAHKLARGDGNALQTAAGPPKLGEDQADSIPVVQPPVDLKLQEELDSPRCDDRLVATEVKLDASDADQVVRHLAELLVVAVDGEREVAGHPIVCIQKSVTPCNLHKHPSVWRDLCLVQVDHRQHFFRLRP